MKAMYYGSVEAQARGSLRAQVPTINRGPTRNSSLADSLDPCARKLESLGPALPPVADGPRR